MTLVLSSLETALARLPPVNAITAPSETLCLKKAGLYDICSTSFKQCLKNILDGTTKDPKRLVIALNSLLTEIKQENPKATIGLTGGNTEQAEVKEKHAKKLLADICKKAHRMPHNYLYGFPSDIDASGENWLRKTLEKHPSFKQKLLNEIVLPATHDSGASFVSFSLINQPSGITSIPIKTYDLNLGRGFFNIEGIVEDFTITQSSIKEQLYLGVRDFDFRVFQPIPIPTKGGPYYLGHQFCTVPLEAAIAEINAFLEEHLQEIIRICVDNDDRLDIKDVADSMTNATTGLKRLHPYEEDSTYHLSIEKMISENQRVVLYFENKGGSSIADDKRIWNGSQECFYAPYDGASKTSAKIELIKTGMRGFAESIKENPESRQKRVLQLSFTRTPLIRDIVLSVFRRAFGFAPSNLQKLALKIQSRMNGFLSEDLPFHLVGSVAVDFANRHLIEFVDVLNGRRAHDLNTMMSETTV